MQIKTRQALAGTLRMVSLPPPEPNEKIRPTGNPIPEKPVGFRQLKAWGFPCGNIILALRAWQGRPGVGGADPSWQNPTFGPSFPEYCHRMVDRNHASVEYPRLANEGGKPPEGDFYRVGLKLLSSVRDT